MDLGHEFNNYCRLMKCRNETIWHPAESRKKIPILYDLKFGKKKLQIMNKRKILVSFLLFNLFGITGISAKKNDFGVWIDYSATKKICSVSFGFLGEIYTRDNSSKMDRVSFGLKGDYQFLPWLSAGTGYVLINFYRDGYNELADRLYFQLEPSWHNSDFYFSFRERMQMTLYPETHTNAPTSYYWRNRLEVVYKHNSSKIEPVTDIETLYRFGDFNHSLTNGYRLTLGVFYHPTKNQKIKFYGMITDGTIVAQYVVGINYEIKL